MWSYIVDGLFIIILLVCIVVGIAKGLLDSVLGLVSTGIALLVSIFCAKYVANFINKIFNFEEFILEKLDGTNEGYVSFFGDKFTLTNVDAAKFCAWVCSLVIVFLAIKLAVSILAKLFESITNASPTISGINRVLGMVFGAIKGGVVVFALFALCSLVAQVPFIGTPVYDAVSNAKISGGIFKFVDEMVEKNLTEENVKEIVDRIVSESTSDDADSENNDESQVSGGNALAQHN